ncbi:uncharacterized protein LOC107856384 isoform X2 [Capsicum annuum]|uniref:uncharacterized protein LOC107856384 isoform X2 n=1 Tax=Capsicum annuum TaxID=4072 RepID=UPI001FB061B6|nr:uncharacterized protein LOC107856384 isoform X2 [Capsicum annuum]
MAGNVLPALGRVKLSDLIALEGLPSDSYKLSVSTLSQSLAQYSAAIIQLSTSDGALLRSSIESARLYFQHKPSYPPADVIHSDDSKTSGYHADPQQWQENYDFRPGLTDKPGLHVRDFLHGHWVLVDGDLGPQEAIVYPGLATAGYISPALHRTDIEMRAAGHGVEAQFQLPVPVDDFMQRSTDQLLNRNNFPTFNFPTAQEGSMKPIMRRRKSNSRSKPLPPSKRLRLEAQRVLKERVQDIADKKGIKLRFCTLKDCENHIQSLDSPCTNVRMEIGWPPGVPFVHPHDLPNKVKIGFLETYEPGWSATHDMELSLIDPGQPSQHTAN